MATDVDSLESFPDSLTSRIWANLPLELIREILFILAMTSDRKTRELRLVSSDVNILVLPLLFTHISVTKPKDVCHLTTVLLPKRKNHMPGLKSRLHIIPRPLATYKVKSCALVIIDRRPSIEEALAKIAPVFCSISKLAITARNLQAHGYWLRQHPIRPKTMMIVHYGSPCLVNYFDPIFANTTHLYTSIIHGHRHSTVADLSSLTHLAVSTRLDLFDAMANNIAISLRTLLKQCKKLQMLVLVMDYGSLSDSELNFSTWESRLESCLSDGRFILLPDFRAPRLEWEDILQDPVPVSSDPASDSDLIRIHESVWQRAKRWKKSWAASPQGQLFKSFDKENLRLAFLRYTQLRAAESQSDYRPEWEVDLVERENYKHPKASDPDLKGLGGFQSAFG